MSREEDAAVPLIKLELTPAARVLFDAFLSPLSLPAATSPFPPPAVGTLGLGFANPFSVSSPAFALVAVGLPASRMANPAVARAIASATSSAESTSAVPAALTSPAPSPLTISVPLMPAAAASPGTPGGTVAVAGSTVAAAPAFSLAAAANTLPPRSSLAIGPLEEEAEDGSLLAARLSPLLLVVTPAVFSVLPTVVVGAGGEGAWGDTPPKEGGLLPGVLCRCRVYLWQNCARANGQQRTSKRQKGRDDNPFNCWMPKW